MSHALALLMALAVPAQAPPARDVRYVIVDGAEVRSGQSTSSQFYVTNRLRRGQPVEVTQELPGGWLKIRPPEGSFSWINTRFLEHIVSGQPNYVVALDGVEVPVYVGSSEIKDRRPWVVGARLKRGAQVTSRGSTMADQEGTWMPIEPPAAEARYLRAEAVQRGAPPPAPPATVAASPPARSVFTPTPGALPASAAPSANVPPTPEALWQRAQDAERAGQTAEAVRLYALVGADAARGNPALAQAALDRARYLQGGHTGYGAPARPAQPPAAVPPPPPAAGRLGPPTSPRPDAANLPPGWQRYRGVLRKAGRAIDGQLGYVLEIDTGAMRAPVLYIKPAAVDLEAHLNREVELWGEAVYRGDLRNNCLTAYRAFAVGR